jgi:tripartite-type tricarboxylate transporter receptor subunit TctC
VEQISAEVGRILRSPEVVKNLGAQGVTPAPTTPAEFDRFIASEIERLGMVVKSAGIQLE